jgi:hypothetical protein
MVQAIPDSERAARYGSQAELGHCSSKYEWARREAPQSLKFGEALSISDLNARARLTES